MLRESLFSLYRSWNSLPEITVVSDGSWTANEFAEVFAWWPDADHGVDAARNLPSRLWLLVFQSWPITFAKVSAGSNSPRLQPRRNNALCCIADADILWFRDPAAAPGRSRILGQSLERLRESNCHQRRDMALRHCPKVLEPPFVNSRNRGFTRRAYAAGDFLRSMVQEALPYPLDSSCQQTIVATAIKLGGEFFPEKLSLVEFDDVHRFRSRNMWD